MILEKFVLNRLAPLLQEFVKDGVYSPSLFRILTPKDFRQLPKYVVQCHLHPDDVPQGRDSEYLSKISAILGADMSVSKELYWRTMLAINDLWKNPIENDRLNTTIINPMIEEKTIINGEVVWKYDKHWEEKMGFVGVTLAGDCIESFFDDKKFCYYVVNHTYFYIKEFPTRGKCLTFLEDLLGRKINKDIYTASKQIIRTKSDPSKEFGHIKGTNEFNLFMQTPEMEIIKEPEKYRENYRRPETIIKFMESLIPDEFMRNYILSFLRTKLTTFKYSPVVLYFIGAQGSGKDTFVSILSKILGQDYITWPDAKVFLEPYNGWIKDKYFIQLDEYGDRLGKGSDRQKALRKIESYSGSPELQIRAMRQKEFRCEHSLTIILTASNNPLPLETQDRRIAFVRTPNRLDKQGWVADCGGISSVIHKINSEIKDFCFYLATEVENLPDDNYVIAPDMEDKVDLIVESMPPDRKIAHYISSGLFERLEEMGMENDISNFTQGWSNGRIMHKALADLYDVITEGRGSPDVTRALKDVGIGRRRTTRQGANCDYYLVPELDSYQVKYTDSNFTIDEIRAATRELAEQQRESIKSGAMKLEDISKMKIGGNIREIRDTTRKLAQQQQEFIKSGASTAQDIANTKIIPRVSDQETNEIIDAEYTEND